MIKKFTSWLVWHCIERWDDLLDKDWKR